MEHILVIYHAAVSEDDSKNTTEENIYATNLTQEEGDDAFFAQDLLSDPSEQINVVWQSFGKI